MTTRKYLVTAHFCNESAFVLADSESEAIEKGKARLNENLLLSDMLSAAEIAVEEAETDCDHPLVVKFSTRDAYFCRDCSLEVPEENLVACFCGKILGAYDRVFSTSRGWTCSHVS